MTGEVLSSWKEIAAYLGKGVRTVQRWEAEMGLPVRRPGPERHIVIAIPAELDQWVRNGRFTHEEQAKAQDSKMACLALAAINQFHSEEKRRHEAHLARMRMLMTSMMQRLEKNREHASRLVAQCQRQTERARQEQKMKQSA